MDVLPRGDGVFVVVETLAHPRDMSDIIFSNHHSLHRAYIRWQSQREQTALHNYNVEISVWVKNVTLYVLFPLNHEICSLYYVAISWCYTNCYAIFYLLQYIPQLSHDRFSLIRLKNTKSYFCQVYFIF